MKLYIIKWSDISADESYFICTYSFDEFKHIAESIKKEIQPGSTFETDKAYIINRFKSFNINQISAKRHTLWRFFS